MKGIVWRTGRNPGIKKGLFEDRGTLPRPHTWKSPRKGIFFRTRRTRYIVAGLEEDA